MLRQLFRFILWCISMKCLIRWKLEALRQRKTKRSLNRQSTRVQVGCNEISHDCYVTGNRHVLHLFIVTSRSKKLASWNTAALFRGIKRTSQSYSRWSCNGTGPSVPKVVTMATLQEAKSLKRHSTSISLNCFSANPFVGCFSWKQRPNDVLFTEFITCRAV